MTKKKKQDERVITDHKTPKTPKKKNPGGRPSKFGTVNLKAVKLLCERGFTDEEIKDCLHVSEKTWNNWKVKNKEFYESIKDWKAKADREVERSLYEKACGYSMPDTKFATFEGQITDSVEYTKHIPPSDTAMIFWLKNRQPGKWRDKTEVDNIHHVTIEDFVDEIQKA